jgi:flagellar motor switch protein FliN/FliY
MTDNKNPPLPDLESDVELVAAKEVPPTSPDDGASTKGASDLEAVFDVPVHVSAVLGRTRMDVGDLLKLGPGTERLGVTMTEIIKAERT